MHDMVAGCLPEQVCTVIFTLPTEEQQRHRIPKHCSAEMLHLYVEGVMDIESPKLVCCGTVIARNNRPVEESGVLANCRINVEETLHLEISISDEEIDEPEPQIERNNILEVNDLTEFEQRRETIMDNLFQQFNLKLNEGMHFKRCWMPIC